MRLRPLGESGPIASRLSSLANYYKEQAWTWEHMALTRARVIFATSNLFRLDIESEIHNILTIPRDKDKLLKDVSAMRSKLAREKPTNCLWSLKYLRGGMLDIEFIAQYLALRYANAKPAILSNNTLSLIENLTRQGYIDPSSGQFMFENMRLFQALQSMLSLTVEDEITADRVSNFSDALKDRLASVGNSPDFHSLEGKIKIIASKISEIFYQTIEGPANNLFLHPRNKA